MAIPCLFCGSENNIVLFSNVLKEAPTDLLECANCSSLFLSPLPNEQILQNAYREDYYGWSEKQKFLPIIDRWINYFSSSKARNLANQLSNNSSVLDIGCGDGKFLSQLNSYGTFQLFGQELPGINQSRMAKRAYIHLNTQSLKLSSYEDNQFDLISLFHVYEHLLNPVEILDFAQKWLKPSGKLLIEIPHGKSWQMKLFGLNWFHLDLPRHIHFVSISKLISLCEDRGLTLFEQRKKSLLYSPYGFQQSLLNVLHKRNNYLYEGLKGNKVIRKQVLYFLELVFVLFTFPIFAISDSIAALFNRSAVIRLTFQKQSL